MLSTDHAEIVRATLPAVAAHGTQITAEFYDAMFSAHPELRHVFNQGNQANGEQRQALAGAVAAFAQRMVGEDGGASMQVMLSRIANKHASLGVRPEQYTIVGRHLLEAVATVLGPAVTPEVHAAWSEVYWLFATLLIAEEARLYQRTSCDPATLFRTWRVVERRPEAEDVVTFVLEPTDDRGVPSYRPGQYVSVAVTLPGGLRQPRQYSLSRVPADGTIQLTVRRVRGDGRAPDGAVSSFLHQHVSEGDELEVSPPFGDLVLDDDLQPLVLVSAGIGITPVAAMIDHLAAVAPERRVLALHADRSESTHALRGQIATASASMPGLDRITWYEEPGGSTPSANEEIRGGRMDITGLALPPKARVYMCGPIPFMRDVRRALLNGGVREERVHYEVFGPDLWNQSD
ncbi:globin domain-containing protein [Actinomadura kijaniata]|uniref:globin domain-containing protein n=1 Tax=Actinomadura kijaniata TaxID=46161 RepID=UPI003F19DF22